MLSVHVTLVYVILAQVNCILKYTWKLGTEYSIYSMIEYSICSMKEKTFVFFEKLKFEINHLILTKLVSQWLESSWPLILECWTIISAEYWDFPAAEVLQL